MCLVLIVLENKNKAMDLTKKIIKTIDIPIKNEVRLKRSPSFIDQPKSIKKKVLTTKEDSKVTILKIINNSKVFLFIIN